MLRALFAGAAALCVAAVSGVAHAETVRDTAHNFRIDVPSGWKSEANPSDDMRLIMVSSQAQQTGGSCNVVTATHQKSAGLTQAQIDEQIQNEVDEQGWLAMFKSVIFISDVAIEKTGSERINGHKSFYVLATFNSVTPGAPVIPVRLKQYLTAIPGQVFFVTCSAQKDAYAQEEDNFKSVFESFAILNDAVATLTPQGVPSLTLYAQSNFGGTSRVVTQDTPDLSLGGWRAKDGSVSVSGGGLWEVCDATNYAGTCRVVSSAMRRNATAASARRVSPAQATFAVMMRAAGAQAVIAPTH